MKVYTNFGIVPTTVAGNLKLSVELNGSDAKSNYQVQADGTNFKIVNSEGKTVANVTGVAASGLTAGNSAIITATTVTAAISSNEIFSYYDKDGNAIAANALGDYFTGNGTTATPRADANRVYDALGHEIELNTADVVAAQEKTAALNLKFHVGADGTANNKISVNIEALTAKGLGVNGLKVNGEDGTRATDAISVISQAIKIVSTQRSALGAVQNRLEHTINNLDNIVENTTSAESAIRDTDMASEMVKYSNSNILSQAGQSMLAQANQSNQGVLSLLG